MSFNEVDFIEPAAADWNKGGEYTYYSLDDENVSAAWVELSERDSMVSIGLKTVTPRSVDQADRALVKFLCSNPVDLTNYMPTGARFP